MLRSSPPANLNLKSAGYSNIAASRAKAGSLALRNTGAPLQAVKRSADCSAGHTSEPLKAGNTSIICPTAYFSSVNITVRECKRE